MQALVSEQVVDVGEGSFLAPTRRLFGGAGLKTPLPDFSLLLRHTPRPGSPMRHLHEGNGTGGRGHRAVCAAFPILHPPRQFNACGVEAFQGAGKEPKFFLQWGRGGSGEWESACLCDTPVVMDPCPGTSRPPPTHLTPNRGCQRGFRATSGGGNPSGAHFSRHPFAPERRSEIDRSGGRGGQRCKPARLNRPPVPTTS